MYIENLKDALAALDRYQEDGYDLGKIMINGEPVHKVSFEIEYVPLGPDKMSLNLWSE